MTYRSRAAEGLHPEQIMEIVDEAIAFNRRAGLTGCLVYDGGYFVQILEGEKETVEDLFRKISRDNRHLQIDILSQGWACDRMFRTWNMGYLELEEYQDGQKKQVVKEARKEMENASTQNDFIPKVFWYNVYHLLSGSKFYKDI